MKKSYAIALLAVILCLVGCKTVPQYEIVVQERYVYVGVPTTLTEQVLPPKPPDREEYVTASDEKRTVIMTNYAFDLLKSDKIKNNNFKSIREWDDKNKLIIEKKNAEETERVQAHIKSRVKELKNER